MANPRIDDLRKKLDKEPGSRLFAQLAEELRKEGDLAEAIRVSRQGLSHHPNYPSARMTLGRALLDSGDLAAARREFETVLKGAADNILASRYLAECLEGLGQAADALERYRATLALAPGDKQLQARIQALEKAPSAPPAATRPAEPARAPGAPAVASTAEDTDSVPIRLVEVEGPMELTSRYDEAQPLEPQHAGVEDLYKVQTELEAPAPSAAGDVTPIPLTPADEEDFEIERPYEGKPVSAGPDSSTAVMVVPQYEDDPILEADADQEQPLLPVPEAPAPVPLAASGLEPVTLEPDVMDEEFEVETPAAAGPPRVTFRDIVVDATAAAAPPAAAPSAVAPPPPAPPVEPARPASHEPELSSPTLAELYFDQGFLDKAVEVYRRLLQREPENERLRARVREIEARQRPSAAADDGAPGNRQEAIGRVIARLQDLRAALARRD